MAADFELCFTAAPEQVDCIRADFELQFDSRLTRVGHIVDGNRVRLVLQMVGTGAAGQRLRSFSTRRLSDLSGPIFLI